MLSFHDGLADEFRRGGHLGKFCAWLAFHRYQRVCDTRSLAHLALRAGDAVLVDVETPYDAARKKRTDPKEQGTIVPSKMRMWAPGGPAHLLRGARVPISSGVAAARWHAWSADDSSEKKPRGATRGSAGGAS